MFFWYLMSILYLKKPNLQYPILPDSEIIGLTTLLFFGLSLFSTRWPLSLPSLFSSLPNSVKSVCCRWWRTLRELVIGWICLSPFHFPLLSSWPPLSTSSLSSSLYNSVNISEQSRLWSAHKEVITG